MGCSVAGRIANQSSVTRLSPPHKGACKAAASLMAMLASSGEHPAN